MLPTQQGSLRLFRLWGIDVFLHWSWFVVAAYSISSRTKEYSSIGWTALEYLALFLIVLLHEFGHALACRQVGGRADQIVLWPLGGVAYVSPPMRPGATLWSIAAGPLVNVVLAPFLIMLMIAGRSLSWNDTQPDAYQFFQTLCVINLVMLTFNLLPIYPLDGGQILRSLLWFAFGRARSLMVATIVGFVGVAVLIAFALLANQIWIGIISVFILLNCWRGLSQARMLSRAAQALRHEGFACPVCQTAPPLGLFWGCSRCRKLFDTFATRAVCPYCGAQFGVTQCMDCGAAHSMSEWTIAPPLPSRSASPPPLNGTWLHL